jgi:hypothetical protein
MLLGPAAAFMMATAPLPPAPPPTPPVAHVHDAPAAAHPSPAPPRPVVPPPTFRLIRGGSAPGPIETRAAAAGARWSAIRADLDDPDRRQELIGKASVSVTQFAVTGGLDLAFRHLGAHFGMSPGWGVFASGFASGFLTSLGMPYLQLGMHRVAPASVSRPARQSLRDRVTEAVVVGAFGGAGAHLSPKIDGLLHLSVPAAGLGRSLARASLKRAFAKEAVHKGTDQVGDQAQDVTVAGMKRIYVADEVEGFGNSEP